MTALSGPGDAARRLNELLLESGLEALDQATGARFEAYLDLLKRWNERTNLTAVRDAAGILRRHFVESIGCAAALPREIGTLLDFGSGAGFPGMPIALCRAEIRVTLAESQGKKAAFLREAVRTLGIPIAVHGGRAEDVGQTFDCVTLRAVDRMDRAVRDAAGLVQAGGWLAVLTTDAEVGRMQAAAGAGFCWEPAVTLPGGDQRMLLLGRRG